jgi:hypothetical protein
LTLAVHDALAVRGVQRRGNLARDRESFLHRQRALFDTLR